MLEVVSEWMGDEVEISRDESPDMDEDGDEPTVDELLWARYIGAVFAWVETML